MRRPRMSRFLSELTSVHEEASDDEDSASAAELRRQHILESMAKLEGRPTDSSHAPGIQKKSSPSPNATANPPGHQLGFLPYPHPHQFPMPVPAPFFYYYPSAPAHMLYAQPQFQPFQIQNNHSFTKPQSDPRIVTSAEVARLPPSYPDLTKVNQRSLSIPGPQSYPSNSQHASTLIRPSGLSQSRPLLRSMVDAPSTSSPEDHNDFERRTQQLSPYQNQRDHDSTFPSNIVPNPVGIDYALQLRSSEPGKRLVDKKRLSVAEVNLLETLPPKPPMLTERLQKVDNGRESRKAKGKDEFSWFDY